MRILWQLLILFNLVTVGEISLASEALGCMVWIPQRDDPITEKLTKLDCDRRANYNNQNSMDFITFYIVKRTKFENNILTAGNKVQIIERHGVNFYHNCNNDGEACDLYPKKAELWCIPKAKRCHQPLGLKDFGAGSLAQKNVDYTVQKSDRTMPISCDPKKVKFDDLMNYVERVANEACQRPASQWHDPGPVDSAK